VSLATGIDVAYLVASIAFILALRGLSSPKSARAGNLIGAVGMFIALGMTLSIRGITNFGYIAAAMAIGAAIGIPAARLVKMTAMPQMVAMFNGVGGAAAALVSLAEFARQAGTHPPIYHIVEVVLGVIIGCVSFTGSVISFAKLQELMTGRPVTYPAQQAVNAVLALCILAAAGAVIATATTAALVALLGLSLVMGVAFVLPIGGADVPVLISLLNAFTGLSVAATGFVLHSVVLVVAGTLVGASGTMLTRLMSIAMGRSLTNILFGAFGSVVTATGGAGGAEGATVRSGTPEDIAVMLAYARKVAIVPGYGLAVAQAQHAARELADALSARGVEVFYAIHPVAGRMPGHMNVLLAEANVPYEQLKEMAEANPELVNTDAVIVVGANDVVNPAARDSPGSPIYGMPIIDLSKVGQIIFMKRSMRPGFAGIDNALLYDPRTTMLFGDAKETLTKLVSAVKAA
jgi:NAD(P) transhydrogenase subunit beta